MRETEWMRIFGKNLDELLREARMSQSELADAIGVSQSTVSKYIHGEIMPSVKALVNIYYTIDCNVGDIFDFGDRIGLD